MVSLDPIPPDAESLPPADALDGSAAREVVHSLISDLEVFSGTALLVPDQQAMDVGEVGQTIAEVDQVTASATTHKDVSRSDEEINGGMVDGRQKEVHDIPALDGSKKEWRNVGHSTQENRRSHKPSDGSESAITVSPSRFQPLADVDEEEISDDQGDFEEGELIENKEASLKTTRKAPKDHNQYIPTVQRIWDSSPPLFHSSMALHLFHRKLKLLKSDIRALNRTQYGDITTKTREAYAVLCDRQNEALVHPSVDSFWIAAEALDRWNHLVQSRNAKNAIESLLSSSRKVVIDAAYIKKETVDHFQRFLQTQQDTSLVSLEESPLAGRCVNAKNHRDGNCGCRLDL
ncbi:hypothetical protein HID58_087393 [Brassica napus]|uniref:Uncharacterized protein n=1 Tax=Brassica napus TaxID=3708 RepID=A0ABQ7XTA6_BRANA|nr:hypothetical protein HID58_087393 [Brassica napus]